jgi:hypothetical protein
MLSRKASDSSILAGGKWIEISLISSKRQAYSLTAVWSRAFLREIGQHAGRWSIERKHVRWQSQRASAGTVLSGWKPEVLRFALEGTPGR